MKLIVPNVKLAMRNGKSTPCLTSRGLLFTCCALVSAFAVLPVAAQNPNTPVSPNLDGVVTLSRGGMSQDVIEAFIANSGNSYSLTAADLEYLHKQGVSDAVIDYLLKTDPSVGSAPTVSDNPGATPSPAPSSVTTVPAPRPTPDNAAQLTEFKTQLSPYGNWSDVPGYGVAWQPSSLSPQWRPYFDGGFWMYSDEGWYWRTDYAWGDIAFHYGRWVKTPRGWFWVPGYDYAPSWVVWRHADADGYIGWAPLPPGATLVNGGWVYRGVRVAQDFDFGLGPRDFAFVSSGGFWSHDYHRFAIADALLADVFRRTRFENHFWWHNGRFINNGIDSAMVSSLTHRQFQPIKIQDLRDVDEARNGGVRQHDLQVLRESGARPDSTALTFPDAANRGARREGGGRANETAVNEHPGQNNRQGGVEKPTTEAATRGARRGNGERETETAKKETPVQNTRRGGTEKTQTEAKGEPKGRGETPKSTKTLEPEKKPVRGARETEAPREEKPREERPREEKPRKENERGAAGGN